LSTGWGTEMLKESKEIPPKLHEDPVINSGNSKCLVTRVKNKLFWCPLLIILSTRNKYGKDQQSCTIFLLFCAHNMHDSNELYYKMPEKTENQSVCSSYEWSI